MADITAYCMKCRTKRKISNPKAIVHPNGKKAITGKCSACGTKVFRMGTMKGVPAAADPEEPESKGKSKSKGKHAVIKVR